MTLHSDSETKARMQWGFWRIWAGGGIKAVRDSAFFSPLSAPFSGCLFLLLSLFLSLHNRSQSWNMSITTWIPWKEALLEVRFPTPQCGAEFLSGSIRCPFLAGNLPRGRKGWKQVLSPILQNGSGTCHGKGEGKLCGSLTAASLNAERHSSLVNGVPSAFCSAVSQSSFSFPPKKSTQINIPRKDTPGALNYIFIFKILI